MGGHHWRVRAVDAAGNLGPWSDTLEFYIGGSIYLPLVLHRFLS
jgi:hypothetical protein